MMSTNRNVVLYHAMTAFSTYVHKTYFPEILEGEWQIKGQAFGYQAGRRLNCKYDEISSVLFRFQWLNNSDLLLFQLSRGNLRYRKRLPFILEDLKRWLLERDLFCILTSDNKQFDFVGDSNASLAQLMQSLFSQYQKPRSIHPFIFCPQMEEGVISVRAGKTQVQTLSSDAEIDLFIYQMGAIGNQISTFRHHVLHGLEKLVGKENVVFSSTSQTCELYGISFPFRIRHVWTEGNHNFRIRVLNQTTISSTLFSVEETVDMIYTYIRKKRLQYLFH